MTILDEVGSLCFVVSTKNMPKEVPTGFLNLHREGLFLAFLYSDLFVIFTGNLMFRILFSCFRWKAFIFSSSMRVSAHVLQFYSSMDFTRDLQKAR